MERRGKCKKKFKFSAVTSHCEPLFSNQTSMGQILNLLTSQSFGKKNSTAGNFDEESD
jgi:hypothetical protein